jgi:hypothetical protein
VTAGISDSTRGPHDPCGGGLEIRYPGEAMPSRNPVPDAARGVTAAGSAAALLLAACASRGGAAPVEPPGPSGAADPPPAPAPALSCGAQVIDRPGGRGFGQTSLADVDRDGDLDFISGANGGPIYWFEHRRGAAWIRHALGGPARTDVGGVAIDVDGDGWIDQISGGDWYRNPGGPRPGSFARHANGVVRGHDNVAGDLDGDRRLDLVALSDDGVWWYELPADPVATWTRHELLGRQTPHIHGGLALGDLDHDGDVDVTVVDRWLENADGRGTRWISHRSFDFGRAGPFGVQTRARVVDLDRDGDNDLVQTEGDIVDGRAAWFENRDGRGRAWVRHVIRAGGHGQDLHSLVVADFDGDGAPDVFSCGGPLTRGPFRWIVWRNADGRAGAWTEHVIHEGVECHEAVGGDVDGDGDIDLCSKPWAGDTHVFLENLRRR